MLRGKTVWKGVILLGLAFHLIACEERPTPAPAASTEASATISPAVPTPVLTLTKAPPIPTPSPTPPTPKLTAPPTPTSKPTAAPTSKPAALLPPEPRQVSFRAEDGQALEGTYYPGQSDKAPLVVLMHWAPGDAREWEAIAPWLQNRGLAGPASPPANKPWLDGSWFPRMPEGRSYAVFTFTFRNCQGGCRRFERGAWLLDAKAAMRTARGLEGVDPQRIVAVGASIGADGAADACYALNEEFPSSCLGAFSLSPGDYLTIPYADAVARLGQEVPPKPAWCFYADEDVASAKACRAAQGENYRAWRYTGRDHGMILIKPGLDPDVLTYLLRFLEDTLR